MNTKANVLLIDDHAELLEFIADDLMEDYHITKCASALDAYSLFEHENFDLIVSDVMMPDMDGFEFCEKVKSDMNLAHIPVILLTAKNTIESKIKGLEWGRRLHRKTFFFSIFACTDCQSAQKPNPRQRIFLQKPCFSNSADRSESKR